MLSGFQQRRVQLWFATDGFAIYKTGNVIIFIVLITKSDKKDYVDKDKVAKLSNFINEWYGKNLDV